MALLDRLFGRRNASASMAAGVSINELPKKDDRAIQSEANAETLGIDAKVVSDVLRVEEVSDADFYIGDLFRRCFGGDPPNYPRHYIALYRQARSTYLPVGYVHYTSFEDSYLCGGMVIDDRLYRRISPQHRQLIRSAGGIAEFMLRESFSRLPENIAIWGYVGNKQAEEVDLRVGFVHTEHAHVMVVWNAALPLEDRAKRLSRVVALGPF